MAKKCASFMPFCNKMLPKHANKQKAYFNQHLDCTAPKRWSNIHQTKMISNVVCLIEFLVCFLRFCNIVHFQQHCSPAKNSNYSYCLKSKKIYSFLCFELILFWH